LTVWRTAIPAAVVQGPAHAVPVMPDIPQVRDIAVLRGIRITTRANATSVRKGIINTARALVTAARQDIPIITMENATSVPKGIINTTRAPVIAARRDTRIIITENAIRSPRGIHPREQILLSYPIFRSIAVPAARRRGTCSVPDG